MKRPLLLPALLLLLLCGFTAMSREGNTRNKSSNAYRNNYERISAGQFSTFEIRGGALYAWGDNTYGQLGLGNTNDQHSPVQVGNATNWVSINAHGYHALALRSDGTLWASGYNAAGQLGIGNNTDSHVFVQVGNDNKWVSVGVGVYSSAGIKSDGTLWTWGDNTFGQLGIGSTVSQNAPVQVGVDNHWVSLSVSENNIHAVKSDGSLWAWGYNFSGQLGQGNTTDQYSPVQMGSDRDWVSVCGGSSFVVALKSNGTLWSCGLDNVGQLGLGALYLVQYTLTQIGTDNDWVSIACGISHMHALKANGTLWSWGSGSGGRLGTGVVLNTVSPTQVGSSHNWTAVTAGNVFGIGVQAGGRVFAWGANSEGQLGIGNTIQQLTPVPTSSPAIEWINISTGGNHTVGVRSEGSLWVWGANASGQLGLGNVTDIHFPWQLDADTTWVGVAAGSVHTLAIKANGKLYAWGGNTTGQLGNGNTTDQHSPVQIGNDSNWTSISAGRGHSVALKSNGTLWTWGLNSYGQLGNGNNTNSNVPTQVGSDHDWISVMAGSDHTLALKSNGTLWAWGYNNYGQLGTGNNTNSNVPVQVGLASDWASISGGGYHNTAIKADGTLWAWGYNFYGQLGNGNNLNSNVPVQIGAGNTWIGATTGEEHSFAFKTDGTAMSWGSNGYGQLGLNNFTDYNTPQAIPSQSGVVQLFCGAEGMHSTLIKDARTLVCLAGRNSNGQLGNNTILNSNNYNCVNICVPVTPTVNITVSPNDTLCGSQSVLFTASPTNGGPVPLYQWYKNGFPVGVNAPTYTDNSLVNSDVISCIMTSSAGCALPISDTDTVHMVINSPSNSLAGNSLYPESMVQNISAPTDVRYYADCDLMASITPSGAFPINGNTTVKVTKDLVVNSFNGQPYVQRHFDIEPVNAAGSATATVTLYAYQSEFDVYNIAAAAASLPPLPTGAVDNGNVRVTQFHGVGTAPGNYTGTEVLITPTVSWDATNGWWVMTFNVVGFSGFYIHTAWGPDPLDIAISNIGAQNEGSRNRVDWTSATETRGGLYTIQRSADGRNFTDIGTTDAKGIASAYTYWDEKPFSGINYYRIKMNEPGGKSNYTKVVDATVKTGNTFNITASPNPAHNNVSVTIYGTQTGNSYISITDLTGKELRRVQLSSASASIDLSGLAQGIYMLKYTDDVRTETMKMVKE